MGLQTQFYHENVPVLLEGDELFAGGARVGTYKSKIYDFIGNTSDEDAKSWDYQWEVFKELHTKALEHYPNFNEKNFTSQFKIDLSTVQGKGKKILDAGAGTGRNARMLASHDFEVYALDGSKSAYYQSASSEDKRVIWVRSPLAQLPIKPGFFDGILCDGVIPHVSKIDNVLHEFHRVLAPNGVLFLSYSSPPKELFSAHNMVKIYRIFTTRMKYENILRLAKFLSSFYVLVKALKGPNILKRIPLLLVPDQSSYDQWRECYIFDRLSAKNWNFYKRDHFKKLLNKAGFSIIGESEYRCSFVCIKNEALPNLSSIINELGLAPHSSKEMSCE